MKTPSFNALLALCLTTLLTFLPTAVVQAQDSAVEHSGERAMAISVDAEITAVDQESREMTVLTPAGEHVTFTVGDHIKRLKDFAVGDVVTTTYLSSLEGELRAPTEEELAEPWVELDAAAKAGLDMHPSAIVGRVIRAVCTIEGLNRLIGTVTVRDPRGKYHVIADVEPEKMEGVTLGSTLVLTYSEALAVTLVKLESAG